jgi:hypothetical protein
VTIDYDDALSKLEEDDCGEECQKISIFDEFK